jgi:hypothetical protein
MTISSQTPEGLPNRCPICRKDVIVEPLLLFGDATCPNCGSLHWVSTSGIRGAIPLDRESPRWRRRRQRGHVQRRQSKPQAVRPTAFSFVDSFPRDQRFALGSYSAYELQGPYGSVFTFCEGENQSMIRNLDRRSSAS